MNRVCHYLKGNLSSESPHLLGYLDTESKQVKRDSRTVEHHLDFGWLCTERSEAFGKWDLPQWSRFSSPEEAWEQVGRVIRPKTKLYLFAHNWHFDATILNMFNILPAVGWKLTRGIIEGQAVIIRWRKENRTILCLDTFNWYRYKLEKLGERLGIEKLPFPSENASKEEKDIYCRRDVEIVRQSIRSWLDFVKVNDLGGLAPTLASQAFKAYRHRFMPHKILIDTDEPSQSLARESFHGGRTEAFYIGKVDGPIYYYDFNSMYPAVMRENLYPRERFTRTNHLSVHDLSKWLEWACIVARVRIEISEPRYAHFNGEKLLFPVGRFTTTLTTPDLITALERDEIRACEEAVVYERADIFSSFVTELYRLRLKAKQRGDDVAVWQIKILMNSLYGKFAQKGQVWEKTADIGLEDGGVELHVDTVTGTMRRFRRFSGVTQELLGDEEARDSFPAISAHVTAFARQKLWGAMEAAGRENVFYVDTDSLYVNQTGADRLSEEVDSYRLGALKLESTLDYGEIFTCKDYSWNGERTCKGIKPNAVELEPGRFLQEQWPKFAGLLQRGSLDTPLTLTVEKRLSRSYDKGIIGSDGTVSPFSLSNW